MCVLHIIYMTLLKGLQLCKLGVILAVPIEIVFGSYIGIIVLHETAALTQILI